MAVLDHNSLEYSEEDGSALLQTSHQCPDLKLLFKLPVYDDSGLLGKPSSVDMEKRTFLWGGNPETRLRKNTFETSDFLEQCWPILANQQFQARAVSPSDYQLEPSPRAPETQLNPFKSHQQPARPWSLHESCPSWSDKYSWLPGQ